MNLTNTAAGAMLPEEDLFDNAEKSISTISNAGIYPNPNNGEMLNLNVSDVKSGVVEVRMLDSTGRLVFSDRYIVDGSLNTAVSFARPLPSGLYHVEFTFDGKKMTERMIVQN